jgi:hypothetical protein
MAATVNCGNWTMAWECTPKCKPLSEQVADLEKQLADLKAKQAAEAAEKAKTYGQRVAEQLVVPYAKEGGPGIHFKREPGVGGHAFACESGRFSDPPQKQIENVRKFYAAALDKAHADGKAQQRQADAKVLTEVADEHRACMNTADRYYAGCESGFRRAADVVRGNK